MLRYAALPVTSRKIRSTQLSTGLGEASKERGSELGSILIYRCLQMFTDVYTRSLRLTAS